MQVVNATSLRYISSIVGGLMARATEAPRHGFRVASSDLNAVLDPERVS